nr:glycosyltransferase [uncultured Albidiferax sp.]
MQAHLNFLRRKLIFRVRNKLHTITSLRDTPKAANVLLVTVPHELAETQLYPFHFYRSTLRQKYGVRCTQVPVDALVGADADRLHGGAKHAHIKRIFFQPAFEMPPQLVVQALERLAAAYPMAKIAFMDWYAPLHIRPAAYVDPYIDIYIKKQTYADFTNYSLPTLGDTNLNDYYAHRHNLPDAQQQFIPPAGIEKKIRLGSNFGLSPLMVDLFLGKPPQVDSRDIDLHARIAVKGVPWYQVMRQEAKDAVQKLSENGGIHIVSEGRVRRHKFFEEMMKSKICFSPFGYGEICWRDYEAYATGALLLKPDMVHLQVLPNVFVPNETYVPLQWDLSDFEEKVEEFLKNKERRTRITRQAFETMRSWIVSKEYVAEIAELC